MNEIVNKKSFELRIISSRAKLRMSTYVQKDKIVMVNPTSKSGPYMKSDIKRKA